MDTQQCVTQHKDLGIIEMLNTPFLYSTLYYVSRKAVMPNPSHRVKTNNYFMLCGMYTCFSNLIVIAQLGWPYHATTVDTFLQHCHQNSKAIYNLLYASYNTMQTECCLVNVIEGGEKDMGV